MLDPETGRSPLVYALIQDMGKPAGFGGSGAGMLPGLGQIPLSTLMQILKPQDQQQPQIGAPQQAPAPLNVG